MWKITISGCPNRKGGCFFARKLLVQTGAMNGMHRRTAPLAFPWEGKVARRPDEVAKGYDFIQVTVKK